MPVPPAISRSPLGRLLGLTPPQIKGALDEPGPRQPYARTLDRARLGASRPTARPLEVVIEVDGRTVWTGAPHGAARRRRAAVSAACRRRRPAASRCSLDAEALPDVAEATLVVRARRPGTRETHEIGRAVITRHAHLEQGFTRTAYGQVWDADLADAKPPRAIAVCGTADRRRVGALRRSDGRRRPRAGRRHAPPTTSSRSGAAPDGSAASWRPPAATGPAATSRRTCCTSPATSLADLPNVSTVPLNGYDLAGVADRVARRRLLHRRLHAPRRVGALPLRRSRRGGSCGRAGGSTSTTSTCWSRKGGRSSWSTSGWIRRSARPT